jgi:DNA-binding transcriptional LysR family regulator
MQKLENILGFPLFERDKNRLSLNATGKLAAEYAHRILAEEHEMEQHLRSFNRSLHTLNIGSIAPGPLREMLPQATILYPGMTIASTVAGEETLLQGLRSDEYNLILLTHPQEETGYVSKEYISEHLNLSVSIMHPAATKKSVTFAEMNGQNFLMYTQVGIWESIVKREMPDSHFFKQETFEALSELSRNSDLPSFTTDVTLKHPYSIRNNRANIPFEDESATLTFYVICKQENLKKWQKLF